MDSKKLHEKMNQYLANHHIMYVKLHNLHWYLKGRSFFVLHAKLEELYDETADIMDEVAERMLALDGKPVASLKGALAIGTIKELEDKPITSEDTAKYILKDLEYLIKATQEIADLAKEVKDGATMDQFNDYLKAYQKLTWMFKAYLE